MERAKQAAHRYENRSLCFSGWLILTMTTHSLHERLRICVFDSLHTILIARREYGSIVVMLKIKRHVKQLLQLILTHTIATVEHMHASGCSHRRSANNMKASRTGEKRCDVVQSSLVCWFAVIFCSVESVSVLLIGHAANTAALHKVVNVLLLKWWKHCCVYDLWFAGTFYDTAAMSPFLQSFIEKPTFRIHCRQIYRSKIHFSPVDVQLCG